MGLLETARNMRPLTGPATAPAPQGQMTAPMRGPVTSQLPTGPAGGSAVDAVAQKRSQAVALLQKLSANRDGYLKQLGPQRYAAAVQEANGLLEQSNTEYREALEAAGLSAFSG